MNETDTSSAALSRAKSYFLVSSMIGNSLTPDAHHEQKKAEHMHSNGRIEDDESHANPVNCSGRTAEQQEEHVNETTTLLPESFARRSGQVRDEIEEEEHKLLSHLPINLRKAFAFLGNFLNAPLIGALIGALIGLAPPLHKAFFADPQKGGIFKAWLTASVKNIGELFPALQLVVVGAKLSGSLLKMKKGEASGEVKIIPVLTIFFIRFILWPVYVLLHF